MLHHFRKRTADVLAPRLRVVFRRLVRLGSVPVCWRQANVTPIPKGPPSSSIANHQPIFITSVLSYMFELWCRFVSDDSNRNDGVCFRNGVIHFACRKGLHGYLWCTFVRVIHCTLQSILQRGQEDRIVPIHFCAALDRINHQVILCKLGSVCSGGTVLSIYWQSIYQIGHSTLMWTIVGVNWLTLYRERRRAIFCPPVHLEFFFHSGE